MLFALASIVGTVLVITNLIRMDEGSSILADMRRAGAWLATTAQRNVPAAKEALKAHAARWASITLLRGLVSHVGSH